MTLVWAFSSIARRVGLLAHAVNWPSIILGVVTHMSASGSLQPYDKADSVPLDEPLYIDFFNAPVLTSRSDMSALLSSHGLPEPIHHLHLDPVRATLPRPR